MIKSRFHSPAFFFYNNSQQQIKITNALKHLATLHKTQITLFSLRNICTVAIRKLFKN